MHVIDPLSSDLPVLDVADVGKRFSIYPHDRSRFFEFLGSRTHHVEHWALRGIRFSVGAGRAFGVVGSNGAGKSTLLRVLAGVTEPTEGQVTVRGRMATLLDLGVSFHAAFTGRENIQLTCALLGMPDDEVEDRIPEIIAFAELAEFIDHPVRTYSTGMHLRLGFSIATHVDAEVLLIDEVLAVGDQYFQRKCIRRIERALGDGATLVLVSHDLHAVRSLCDEVMWIDGGRARAIGPPREVVEHYLELDRLRSAPPPPGAPPRPVLRPPDPADPSRPPPSRRVPTLPGTPVVAHAPHAHLEDDPALLDVLAHACAIPDPLGVFGTSAGEAPRRQDGEHLLVSGTGEVRVLRVQLLDTMGAERERYRTGESLVVAVTFRTTEPVVSPVFGVALFRSDGTYVFGPNTRFDGVMEGTFHGVYTYFIHYPRLPLLAGNYRASIAVFDSRHVFPHVWHNQLYAFEVVQDVEDHGLVQLPHHWGMLVWHEAGADGT